jgi:hypothetical protein
MKIYHVKFSYDGEGELVRSYRAASVIRAFEKCLVQYPGAKLIEARIEGRYLDGYGVTTYKPPSTVRVEAEPAPKEEQMKFDFPP